MIEIRERISELGKIYRSLNANPDVWLMEEFLLQKGIICTAQALPDKFGQMTQKACFANASVLAQCHPELRYCEGYLLCDFFPFPFHHAWTIDDANNVIDPTIPDPEDHQYLGYPISLTEYARWTTKNNFSVLDTGVGRNRKFMLEHCPALKDMRNMR